MWRMSENKGAGRNDEKETSGSASGANVKAIMCNVWQQSRNDL